MSTTKVISINLESDGRGRFALVESNGVVWRMPLDGSYSAAKLEAILLHELGDVVLRPEDVLAKARKLDVGIDFDTGVFLDPLVEPKEAPPSPPRLAEFLFSLLAPKKTVDAELGDMQEMFERRVKTLGKARARMLYWSQVLR